MPERLIDVMAHEMGRWSYMTERQLELRISKMRKIEKLLCCYVVASERGHDSLLLQTQGQIMRVTGNHVGYYDGSIRSAVRLYRDHMMDRPSMSNIRPAEGSILPLPGDGTVPADTVVTTYRDPLTGRHVANVDLVAAGRDQDSHPLAFPPDPDHDTDTCECAMCVSLRKAKHQRAVMDQIRELEREIKKLDKPDTTLRRRIRFKRREVKFRDGWTQPLLGGE